MTQPAAAPDTTLSPGLKDALTSPRLFLRESLAGIVTALALVPEVISFSFISGVDPKSALVASIVLCLTLSFFGGRPAMVTAAAGSIALVIGPMVKTFGAGYILPTLVLAGVIQITFGLLGLSRLMRFVPRSVMLGFVNGLGILIFAAQMPHLIGVPVAVYPLFALTIAIVVLAPRFITAIPAPLIAIAVVTLVTVAAAPGVPDVGSQGPMGSGLPGFLTLTVPLSLETLKIIWPAALSVAFVGLLETLLTAKLVDEMTDTRSHKGQESCALGLANILSGFYGGIGGCAMIGQTVVNVKIGAARTRLSTIVAGLVLLALVTVLSGVMAKIPLVALAAVMMIVAVKTMNWHSVSPATLKRMPWSETSVLAVTTALTVVTGNLALGIGAGVLLAIVLFARRVAHVVRVERTVSTDGETALYYVHGPLFFASSNDLVERFSYGIDPRRIVIDLTHAQIWDASTVAALDSIETRYRDHGATVHFTGLDARSASFHEKLSGTL